MSGRRRKLKIQFFHCYLVDFSMKTNFTAVDFTADEFIANLPSYQRNLSSLLMKKNTNVVFYFTSDHFALINFY